MVAGLELHVDEPLTPHRITERVGAPRPLPWATVHAQLDRADAARWRPRDAGDAHRAGRDHAAGHVDARHRLHRAGLRPAAPDPVRVVVVPARELEVAQPLRRRHVAVQAGDDQACRVAVSDRQLDAVHADRDQRVRCGGQRRGEPARPSVDRSPDELVGVGERACERQHSRERHTRPARGPDESAGDLVGDAADRRVVLLEAEVDQLVEVEHDLTVDAPVDAQRPARRVDAWERDRRVDAVELLDGREDRRQAGERPRQVLCGGERRQATAGAHPVGERHVHRTRARAQQQRPADEHQSAQAESCE